MTVYDDHSLSCPGCSRGLEPEDLCACRELRTDDFDEYRAHVADLIIEHVFRPGVEGTS